MSAPIDSALRIVSTALSGPMREHGDLAALRLFDLQRLFDGVLVELVHDAVDALAVDGLVVGAELLLGPRVGDLLHADDDVHGRRPTSLDWIGTDVTGQ